jgi:hypothetical protein
MKLFYLVVFGFLWFQPEECQSQNEDLAQKEILAVMRKQESAWSKNDLEGFMQGYWRSDSLKFLNSNGITYGWEPTLANYKKRYPTAEHSGILSFTIHSITRIEKESYYVMGEYFLQRKIGDVNGIFLIIFKKIDGHWKIVADMSS